jgi:hypothetical protein
MLGKLKGKRTNRKSYKAANLFTKNNPRGEIYGVNKPQQTICPSNRWA